MELGLSMAETTFREAATLAEAEGPSSLVASTAMQYIARLKESEWVAVMPNFKGEMTLSQETYQAVVF